MANNFESRVQEQKIVEPIARCPEIKNWEVRASTEKGMRHCVSILKTFATFWENVNMDKLEFASDEKCILSGEICGHAKFQDGEEVNTSCIKCVERLSHDCFEIPPHDLMRATTQSGSTYYFYSDEYSAGMCLLLGELIHHVGLS